MSQRMRILIAVLILVALVVGILGIDALQRRAQNADIQAGPEPTVPAGSIPIRVDGRVVGSFGPADLEVLEEASFVDAEEGKTQSGWLLRDVLLLRLDLDTLEPDTIITVGSSSREKTVDLTWAEVDDEANMVMFDLSGRGTLKLVSLLERLDIRDEWVQDVDSVEITNP